MELEQGDDPRKALYEAKKVVESFHFESNKAAQKQIGNIVLEKPENIIKQIMSCKEVGGKDGLASYRLAVRGNKELQNIYDKKLSELNNQTKPSN